MRPSKEPPENAKTFIISEVIENAKMIGERIAEYSITHESYARSTLYQDMLTMPMLRICELVSEYKGVFQEIDPLYPWDEVSKMRSKMAHPYGGFDFEFVWEAIEQDLPGLVGMCSSAIGRNEQ